MSDTPDKDQKSEAPTEKRLSEAHDRGEFAKSQEITVVFSLAAMLCVLGFTTRAASRDIAEYSAGMFTRFATITVKHDTVGTQLAEAMLVVGQPLLPLLVASVVAVLLAGGVQSGFQLTPKAAAFKLDNLDVMAGFGRLFSKTVFVKTGVDLLKLAAIGTALWLGARSLLQDQLFTAPVEAAYLGHFLSHASVVFLSRLVLALGMVAAISYGWEKFKTSRDLMMTR